MGHPLPHVHQPSHVSDLRLVLRTTLSLLKDFAPHIGEDKSLRNLELALLCANGGLERVDVCEQEQP
jgi:hypothetical protein